MGKKMQWWWRKLHRWLGLIVGIQVLLWMLSGLYFAMVPIDKVRGSHLTYPAALIQAQQLRDALPPARALAGFYTAYPEAEPDSIELSLRGEELIYRVGFSADGQTRVKAIAAQSGQILPELTEAAASHLASSALKQKSDVVAVRYLTEPVPGSEYRGRTLPLYQVEFAQPKQLRLYVDANSGEVVARRTGIWRAFDFLWMLHIMDYSERDNFNQPLLIIFAGSGLLIAITGYILWWLTTRWWRGRESRKGHVNESI